jgi:fibronectin type 3 domain-containing protein
LIAYASRKALLQWDTTKKIERFTDTSATLGKTYYYELTAYDDSDNKGKELSGDVWFETGKRPPITEWKATLNNEKKTVTLQWQCTQSEVKQYRIYRSKDNQAFILFATLRAGINSYEDTEVTSSHVYQYKIIAVLKGDVKTTMSKTLEAKP